MLLLDGFLKVKSQDLIAFVEIEFMRFAVLNEGIEFDRPAAVLLCPLLDAGEEGLPQPLRSLVGIDDDIVDLELFPRIDPNRDPAIGDGHEPVALHQSEAVVGGEPEHFLHISADGGEVEMGM